MLLLSLLLLLLLLQLLIRHYQHLHPPCYHLHQYVTNYTTTSTPVGGLCSAWASNSPEWMTLKECCGSGNDLEFLCCFEESEYRTIFISGNLFSARGLFVFLLWLLLFLLFLYRFVSMFLSFLSFLPPLSLDPKDAAPVSPAPLSFSCTSERAPCPGGAAVGGGVFRVRTSPRTEQKPLSL